MACRVSSLLNSDGKMLKTFMFTPSSQKHEQQIKNIPHHQIAIEQTQEGIAIVNVDQKFIYLNQAHVELFGYTSELELIGKTWHILYDHEEQTRIANEIFPNFDNQKSIRFESRGIKKDGTPIFQNVCLTRSQNGDIICSTHDITERKEQENRLKEIAIIAKVTTMMVLVTDKHGTITWVNKSFSQKTNWQAKEIIGQSILKILSTETQIFDDAKKWH
jgi:PAS domain S-box-containing protein